MSAVSDDQPHGVRTATLNPTFDAYYHSYYFQGLVELLGKRRLRASASPFPILPAGCLALIVRGRSERRVVIDAYDGAVVANYNQAGLEWSDIYAKINLARALIPAEHAHKCVPIGPSFPIRIWGALESGWVALKHYRPSVDYRARLGNVQSRREHFANYWRQYRYSLPQECWVQRQSSDDYVFFLSSIWREDETPGTNEYRARFIRCCRSLTDVRFDGGLVPLAGATAPPDGAFVDCMADARLSLYEWLEKTRSSAFVFNTPAVWSCHGFKLAQFLALGKAIISTPLTREMPEPLVHGQHIHYVDGSMASIRDAVDRLVHDRAYRRLLAQNARHYFVNVLSPRRVVERVLRAAVL